MSASVIFLHLAINFLSLLTSSPPSGLLPPPLSLLFHSHKSLYNDLKLWTVDNMVVVYIVVGSRGS